MALVLINGLGPVGPPLPRPSVVGGQAAGCVRRPGGDVRRAACGARMRGAPGGAGLAGTG